MKRAEIIDGRVVNVVRVDPVRVPDWAADWPEITDGGIGWVWDGETFSPPAIDPEETLARARESAMRGIVAALDEAATAITGAVPRAERDSWAQKETEARARVADAGTDAPMLAAEAALTGETIDALAAKIVAQAELFRVAAARIAGIRRAAQTALEAAQTMEDIEAVVAGAEARISGLVGR